MPQESLLKQFPPASWIQDFRSLMETRDRESAQALLRERLYQRAPDSPLAEEYETRFSAAHRYLLRHLSEFVQPDVAVVSENGSVVPTDNLLYSLYLLFMSLSVADLEFDLPVECLITAAQTATRKQPPQ